MQVFCVDVPCSSIGLCSHCLAKFGVSVRTHVPGGAGLHAMASSSNTAVECDMSDEEFYDGNVQMRLCSFDFGLNQKELCSTLSTPERCDQLQSQVDQRLLVEGEIDMVCGHGLGSYDRGPETTGMELEQLFSRSPFLRKNMMIYAPEEVLTFYFVNEPCLHEIRDSTGAVSYTHLTLPTSDLV